MPPEDDDSWILAGEFESPGGGSAVTWEKVRSLSPKEFSDVAQAGELLRQLTTSAPHQSLVAKFRVLQEALEVLSDERTEALDSRLGRASHALRLWATGAQSLSGDVRSLTAELVGEVNDQVAQQLEAAEGNELLAACTDLASTGEVRLVSTTAGQVVAAVVPGPPPRALRLPDLTAAVMQCSEDLHIQVLLTAADLVDDATRRLRNLEAEVLLGRPLLMRVTGSEEDSSSFQMQDLHADLRRVAQTALRVARDRTRSSAGEESPSGPTPSVLPSSLSPESVDANFAAAVEERTDERAEDDWPMPPVAVAALAAFLEAGLSELEEAWSDALTVEAALTGGDETKQRFGSLAAAMIRTTSAEEEALRHHGVVTISRFPLESPDILNLRPEEPLASGDQATLLPQLYALTQFLDRLERLSQPRSVRVEPPNKVRHATFDPGDVLRLKAQVALLARCSALASATTARMSGSQDGDRSTDAEWLTEATRRAFEAGLPEAVVLYAHLAAEAGADWPTDLTGLLAQTVASISSAALGEDLLAVTIPLAFEVAARLDDLTECRVDR